MAQHCISMFWSFATACAGMQVPWINPEYVFFPTTSSNPTIRTSPRNTWVFPVFLLIDLITMRFLGQSLFNAILLLSFPLSLRFKRGNHGLSRRCLRRAKAGLERCFEVLALCQKQRLACCCHARRIPSGLAVRERWMVAQSLILMNIFETLWMTSTRPVWI